MKSWRTILRDHGFAFGKGDEIRIKDNERGQIAVAKCIRPLRFGISVTGDSLYYRREANILADLLSKYGEVVVRM